ncbi:MAG: archaellin/type IV pilin N-terminal domain-containing protein [Zestosphaera sp.]
MTGIEAAIVMIAFVVVAAALAFVVLNMGMFTTQRARETINTGLAHASSVLEVDGSITALVNSKGNGVELISIPLRLAPGKDNIDLNPEKLTVALFVTGTTSLAYENIYSKVMSGSDFSLSSLNTTIEAGSSPNATMVFVIERVEDTVLSYGEKVLLIIKFPEGSHPAPYDNIRVEIRTPDGAPLTVERVVPAILPSGQAVSLG